MSFHIGSMTFLLLLSAACSTQNHDLVETDTPADDPVAWPVSAFGDPDAASFSVVAKRADELSTPMDLAFRPDDPSQLWVANQATDSITIVWNPGAEDQTTEWRKDTFGMHFMEEVSSLAFGGRTYEDELTFATCQESRNTYDDNYAPDNFMGPALWPADLEVFAEVNQSQYGEYAGSHLDMLHGSPLCMGIAHDHENAYWVFDGWNGELVYYDFQVDHGPGRDDHSDGIIRRYAEVELTREERTPSHMVLAEDGWLYIADTGAGRVLRVDTTVEGESETLFRANEPLEEYSEVTGVPYEEVLTDVALPAGLALDLEGNLLVGLAEQAVVLAVDPETGEVLAELQTEAERLGGLAVHPEDGILFYVDIDGNQVHRVEPG